MNAGKTMARSTRQRSAVLELLGEVEEFRSAQDLHTMLRERGEKIGLTTVYRTLQAMAESQDVDVMQVTGGENLYRRCSSGHHHHLVCRACGRAVEIDGPAVERWTEAMAAQHGFTDVSHTVEIFGSCPQCAAS